MKTREKVGGKGQAKDNQVGDREQSKSEGIEIDNGRDSEQVEESSIRKSLLNGEKRKYDLSKYETLMEKL